MSFIKLFDFIIYQHLNKRTKILPLVTSQIAHLCKKALFFYQNSSKIKLFLQKNAKFSSAGGSAPRPPCLRRLGALPPNPQAPTAGGFAPRPPKQPPLANFWLRAWLPRSTNPLALQNTKRLFKRVNFCSFVNRTMNKHV